MHDSTVARKLDALTSEIREVRRLVTKLHDQQNAKPTDTAPAVHHDDQRGVFLPGTGWTGDRQLGDEAQAALTQLDTDRPT
jgi:hypothetical protein